MYIVSEAMWQKQASITSVLNLKHRVIEQPHENIVPVPYFM